MVKLGAKKELSNLTICLLGGLLGLGVGLFLLRGFLFSSGFVFTAEFWWPYSSQLYPMHYVWDEFTQSPVVINQMLGKLWVYPFSAEVGQRLFILSVFPVMGLSMFFVTLKLTEKHHASPTRPLIASTLATLFFMMNPIVSAQLQHRGLLWFYAILPLLVYFAYSAFSNIASFKRSAIFKQSIYIALILFAMSISIKMPLYFAFLFLPFFAAFSRPFKDYLKKSFVLLGLVLTFYALFSCIWWLSIALGSPSGPGFYVVVQEQLSQLSRQIDEALSLNMPQWRWTFALPWVTARPLWEASLIAMPFIAFSSLLLRRDRLTIWLVIFALALIFLTKGTQPPFGGFYHWLVFDSPIISSVGWQLRGPPKWTIPLMFCYSMLIGLTISPVLAWIKERISRGRLRKGMTAGAIIVFLVVPLSSGHPLLTGDLDGAMKPQELPSEYVTLNHWLEEQDSDGKIIFYPRPMEWGSAKPTITYQPITLAHEYSGTYWSYLKNSLNEGSTLRFGELISPYNAKYLVVRTGAVNQKAATEVISTVSDQEDMMLVRQFNSLYVFENQKYSSQIHVTGRSVVVLGELEDIASLTSIGFYHMVDSPIIFLDQSVMSSDYLLGADILVSNKGNLDLCLSLAEDEYLLKPFATAIHYNPRSYWSKGTPNDIGGAKWHPILDKRGMKNWQFDYGEGLVFTWAADALDIPLKVNSSGEYDLLLRYFQNQEGGKMRVLLDGGLIAEITTASQTNQFLWEKIVTLDLSKGKHTITIENVDGFNAVNLLAVIPYGQLQRYKEQVRYLIRDKRIIHIWEAESALNYSKAQVSSHYRGHASKGEVLKLSQDSEVWCEVDILRAGQYRLAIRLDGKAVVNINDQKFWVESDDLGFVYLNPPYFHEGRHTIKIKSADAHLTCLDVIWLYSAQGIETVEDVFTFEEGAAEVITYDKINPTKYQVKVNASQPFMLAFAEAYDSMWVARVDGKEYQSVALNSAVNGFWIEDVGELELTVEYKAQSWFYYGASVTGLSLAGVAGYLVWDRLRRKKRKGGELSN